MHTNSDVLLLFLCIIIFSHFLSSDKTEKMTERGNSSQGSSGYFVAIDKTININYIIVTLLLPTASHKTSYSHYQPPSSFTDLSLLFCVFTSSEANLQLCRLVSKHGDSIILCVGQ